MNQDNALDSQNHPSSMIAAIIVYEHKEDFDCTRIRGAKLLQYGE